VTGSSRGIGKGIALRLAQDGYDIVLHCRSGLDSVQAVAEEIESHGRSVRILQFDIADREECRQVLEQDIDTHGAYYGVVCNAGIARDNAFPAMPEEVLQCTASADHAHDSTSKARAHCYPVFRVR
jgi:3-oxoacyl-[acyl-carrier protein] reductase